MSEKQIEKRARFDFVRYANVWEDPRLLIQSLKLKGGEKVLSIASGGDNALTLLAAGASKVLAFDLSPAQLALCRLKTCAIEHLEQKELYFFLAVNRPLEKSKKEANERLSIYNALSPYLSEEDQLFWTKHQSWLERGLAHCGKFEKYFRIFRKVVLPLIHSQKTVKSLLEEKPLDEQQRFYQNKWNSWRWRVLFRLFFGKKVMGSLGRDREFFRYVEGKTASSILTRTEYALSRLPTFNNPFLNFILLGHYKDALPDYLKPENLRIIKKNLHKLQWFQGDLIQSMNCDKSWDALNLSDIFEYMDEAQFKTQAEHLKAKLSKKVRIAYWNMRVDRDLKMTGSKWKTDSETSHSLHLQDRAWFYRAFKVSFYE